MSTQVQYRRGTSTQNDAFVGALAEITVDTTNKTLRVHDGATAGGSNIATVAYVDNAISSLSANSISDGTTSVTIIATNGNIRSNVGGATVSTVYSDGVLVTGVVSATGNVTGSYIIGNGSQLTGLPAGYANSDVAAYLSSGSVSTNILTTGAISATGNVTGGNLLGTIATASQTNITAVGTLSSLSVSGNVQGGNLRTAGLVSATGTVTGSTFVGSGAGLTAIPAANVTGTLSVNTTGYAATVSGAAQANITSVGTLTSLSVSGNVAAGNLSGTAIVGTLSTAAQTNITSVGTLSSLSVSGNVQGGNLRTAGLVSASGTVTGTTFIGIANQAKYADLAEYYIADADYPAGTVLMFGGEAEVTQSSGSHVTSIAGTVSDKPAYTMNSDLEHEHKTPVVLIGRVPCRVVGTINKGDRLVASHIPGVATVLDAALYQPGSIIGKALENYNNTEPGIIEAVVGRL